MIKHIAKSTTCEILRNLNKKVMQNEMDFKDYKIELYDENFELP